MARFNGPDFCDIDSLLTEEEIMIRDTVRDWVSERYLPLVEKAYREGYFPIEVLPELGEMGVFGGNLDYGDFPRMSNVAYGLVVQELERGDSGLRSFASVQGGLVMYPIWRYGTDAQKEKWLRALHRGEKIGCFGLTEPDHGSDPGGMETKAVKDGDGYVLNGAKMWITNGTIADVAVVWAKLRRRDPRLPRREGDAGLHRARAARQAQPPRLRDERARAAGRAGGRRRPPARRERTRRTAVLSEPGALHASPGARSARPWPASTRSASTASPGPSSASPSRRSSSTRRSSRTCSRRSRRPSS